MDFHFNENTTNLEARKSPRVR